MKSDIENDTSVQHKIESESISDEQPTWRASDVRLLLLYAVCFIEGADLALLPASFYVLQNTLGMTPGDLAAMSLCQALFQSITGPFWGIMIDHGSSSKWLIVAGCFSWGMLTFLLACTSDLHIMLALRATNGFALATLTPVCQTIIPDFVSSSARGRAFSTLESGKNFGQLLGTLMTTSIASSIYFGVAGWRIAFTAIAFASVGLAGVLVLFLDDHRRPYSDTTVSKEFWTFYSYLQNPTFVIIVVQGCLGSIPWSALGFLVMFFQCCGISGFFSALIVSFQMLGGALGQCLGGHVSDALTRWSRFHGRPLTAQLSVALSIPAIFVVLAVVPPEPSSVCWYVVILFCFGLTATWCAGGVNKPTLTEVVMPIHHARIISWLSALEGSSAACFGSPLVAFLAEHIFGYNPVTDPSDEIKSTNKGALATGMLWMTTVPWIGCFTAYCFLHWTYKRDYEIAKMDEQAAVPIKL